MRRLIKQEMTWSCSECTWSFQASRRTSTTEATQQATFFFNAHNCRRHARPEPEAGEAPETESARFELKLDKWAS